MKYKDLLKDRNFRWLLAALAVVAPLEILSLFDLHLPPWAQFPLVTALAFFFGRGLLLSGVRSLLRLDFSNMNLLMTIAIGGALYLGHWEEAAVIIVLFALGETLEDFGITKSQVALQELVEKAPKTAQVKGKEGKVPVELVEIGEMVIVKPIHDGDDSLHGLSRPEIPQRAYGQHHPPVTQIPWSDIGVTHPRSHEGIERRVVDRVPSREPVEVLVRELWIRDGGLHKPYPERPRR